MMGGRTIKHILIALPELNEGHRERLRAAGAGNDIRFVEANEVAPADIEWAEVIVGNVPAPLLHEPGKLEFYQLCSSGADAYVAEGILDRRTILATCTGAYSQTVAEHALASTLVLQKNLHLYRDAQRRHEWTGMGRVGTMEGAVVLVVGLGEIGCYYARMAKALGAYVIGVKRRASEKPDYVDELYLTAQLDEVLGRADVVMSVLPGSAATEHFYTAERFRAMKRSCIFVNCGRGNAVAMDVLEQALRGGEIACAAVDVFEIEPLPASSPLWDLDNLLVTPHASGFYHLPATVERMVDICVKNLAAYLAGGELMNVVDFNTGYKK